MSDDILEFGGSSEWQDAPSLASASPYAPDDNYHGFGYHTTNGTDDDHHYNNEAGVDDDYDDKYTNSINMESSSGNGGYNEIVENGSSSNPYSINNAEVLEDLTGHTQGFGILARESETENDESNFIQDISTLASKSRAGRNSHRISRRRGGPIVSKSLLTSTTIGDDPLGDQTLPSIQITQTESHGSNSSNIPVNNDTCTVGTLFGNPVNLGVSPKQTGGGLFEDIKENNSTIQVNNEDSVINKLEDIYLNDSVIGDSETDVNPETTSDNMTIVVGDPIKVGDITSAHTVYSIHTKSSTIDAAVTRRYRDFRWLYHVLQLGNPGIIVPPPPEKQAVGRFNEGFIEQRRLSLESMIKKISDHPILVKDEDFLIFLKSENFNNDVKHNHPNVDLNESIYVDNTTDSNNLLLNTKPSTGFMASLNFSFTPKFIETDEWFYEKKHYIDGLEVNLKGLLKALEVIIQHRRELSETITEFSCVMSKLSLIEISKPLSDILDSFAQSQLNIKEVYQRQCSQDMLTFGNILEEYIRIITSVKSVFSQRINIDLNLQRAEHEMDKKKKRLDKLLKQGKSYQVKIDAVNDEINIQEDKILNIKVMFDNITRTIKAEFKRFEKIRIDDFRNTCEIFLENSIEAQKEAIEIWETFYQFAEF